VGIPAKNLETLVKLGADINQSDAKGNTILHYAVTGCDTELVRIFLLLGAHVNAQNVWGSTPIHIAIICASLNDQCLSGYMDIIELLINHKADLRLEDTVGKTPLCEAVIREKPDIMQVLIKGGASIYESFDWKTLPVRNKCYGELKLEWSRPWNLQRHILYPLTIRKSIKSLFILWRRGNQALSIVPKDIIFIIHDFIASDPATKIYRDATSTNSRCCAWCYGKGHYIKCCPQNLFRINVDS